MNFATLSAETQKYIIQTFLIIFNFNTLHCEKWWIGERVKSFSTQELSNRLWSLRLRLHMHSFFSFSCSLCHFLSAHFTVLDYVNVTRRRTYLVKEWTCKCEHFGCFYQSFYWHFLVLLSVTSFSEAIKFDPENHLWSWNRFKKEPIAYLFGGYFLSPNL